MSLSELPKIFQVADSEAIMQTPVPQPIAHFWCSLFYVMSKKAWNEKMDRVLPYASFLPYQSRPNTYLCDYLFNLTHHYFGKDYIHLLRTAPTGHKLKSQSEGVNETDLGKEGRRKRKIY